MCALSYSVRRRDGVRRGRLRLARAVRGAFGASSFRRAAAARSLLSCTTGGRRRFRIAVAHPHLCDWRRHAANRDNSAALCLRLAPGAPGKSVSRGRRGIGLPDKPSCGPVSHVAFDRGASPRASRAKPKPERPGLAAARRPPETEAFPRARPISCPSGASAATMFLEI